MIRSTILGLLLAAAIAPATRAERLLIEFGGTHDGQPFRGWLSYELNLPAVTYMGSDPNGDLVGSADIFGTDELEGPTDRVVQAVWSPGIPPQIIPHTVLGALTVGGAEWHSDAIQDPNHTNFGSQLEYRTNYDFSDGKVVYPESDNDKFVLWAVSNHRVPQGDVLLSVLSLELRGRFPAWFDASSQAAPLDFVQPALADAHYMFLAYGSSDPNNALAPGRTMLVLTPDYITARVVPEPSTALLACIAVVGLLSRRWRKRSLKRWKMAAETPPNRIPPLHRTGGGGVQLGGVFRALVIGESRC